MLNVEVLPTWFNRVELTFTETVGDDSLWQVLNEELEGLYGVEEVRIKRYSGYVDLASHLVQPDKIAAEIVTMINEESVLREALLRYYPEVIARLALVSTRR